MLIPVIKVIDRGTGYTHIVGTNHHDALVVSKDGRYIYYYNLQNSMSSRYPEEFEGKDYSYKIDSVQHCDYEEPHIEFVTLEEWVKLSQENISEQVENMIEFYNVYVKRMREKMDKETHGLKTTAGEIIE